MRVTSDDAMKMALAQWCSIRLDIARRYLAKETPPIKDPSLQQLREYNMPGTAIQECHTMFRAKLEDVLRKSHEGNEKKKKPFESRAACRPIEKRIPLARFQHHS
jgi:hypothetical protein